MTAPAKCTQCARNAMITVNGLCAECAAQTATAPVSPPAPWPMSEAHRRACADIAATAAYAARAAVDDANERDKPSERAERVRYLDEALWWLDIATRADALSRLWGGR